MSICYHYCSEDTFKLIISNGSLRLSDIRKSNDYYEMIMFLIEHEGLEYLPAKDGYWKDLKDYISLVTDNIECYASCLSIGSDRLSQWERYADSCKGFAIGFNEKMLQSYIQEVANKLPIYAGERDSFEFVELLAKKIVYKRLTNYSYPHEMAMKTEDIPAYREECVFTKDYGFFEEEEFRIALFCHKGNRDFLANDFKNCLGKFKDDLKETIFFDLTFPKEVIEEIYMGPLNKSPHKDVIGFLRQNDVYCNVKKSTIPYSPKRV